VEKCRKENNARAKEVETNVLVSAQQEGELIVNGKQRGTQGKCLDGLLGAKSEERGIGKKFKDH